MPPRAFLLATLLLISVITAGCGGGNGQQSTPPPPPVPGTVPPALFSLTVHNNNNWPSVPLAGIRLWSTGTYWQNLNPAPGLYDFSTFDQFLNAAQAHNVDVLYTFGEVPRLGILEP